MALAIFDLDNTLLAGDSDYLWGMFLAEQGIVDRHTYEEQNQRYYDAYKEGTLDIFQRGVGGCLHCLRQHRSIADLDAAAGNCAGGAVFGPAVGVLGVMQGQLDATYLRRMAIDLHLEDLLDRAFAAARH